MKKHKIYVYETRNNHSILVGNLVVLQKGQFLTSAFKYSDEWLFSSFSYSIDPELHLNSKIQYTKKSIFGVFTDCCPNNWGKFLLQQYERIKLKKENRRKYSFSILDYLLLSNDYTRQGSLRFKISPNEDFLTININNSIPYLSKLPELLLGTKRILKHEKIDLTLFHLFDFSLGGARPKASLIDNDGDLCIAKFPKKGDINHTVLWEAVALSLAQKAGLNVPKWNILYVNDEPVLVIKRFDRNKEERIPFMSAMTMLSGVDGDKNYSYTDLADCIRLYGNNPQKDLLELWKRLLFSVCISNTDDHLRNHGFLKKEQGWELSPIYDINPNIENTEYLSTMIFRGDFSTSIESVLSIAYYFEISEEESIKILLKTLESVSYWKEVARSFGILSSEINVMERAFITDYPLPI